MRKIERCMAVVLAAAIGGATCFAGVVSGRITCEGKGVVGVPVSDGVKTVVTDKKGNYKFNSDKELGYVFYTLPSGYEPTSKGAKHRPDMWAYLDTKNVGKKETHNFELKKVDNDKFELVVITDIHLADRVDDLNQFKNGFMDRVNELVDTCKVPVYTVALGDMSWDRYWYENEYGPAEFMATLDEVNYPTFFFPITGNHDNDGGVAPGENTDLLSSAAYRANMAPSYYSFNLGGVHFVMLDDIVYQNHTKPKRKYAKGIVGDRDYYGGFTDAEMEWLRNDLALVPDKSTPIVVCVHIPIWRMALDGSLKPFAGMGEESMKVSEVLKDYDTVRILSGHSHVNGHAISPVYPNIHEDNVTSLCGIFWNGLDMCGREISHDGSPAAYKVYSFDNRKFKSRLENVARDEDVQFRVYDMNTVKATYANDSIFNEFTAKYPTRVNYANIDDNLVYINVFDYEPGDVIEVWENGAPLEIERLTTEDPLKVIAFDIEMFKQLGSVSNGQAAKPTHHIFRAKASTADAPVRVRLTDVYGQVSERTLDRPGSYTAQMH